MCKGPVFPDRLDSFRVEMELGDKRAFAVSVGTGDRVLLDDPHNVKEAESDTIRTETVRWFRETMSNRLNNDALDAGITLRVHEDDV